MTILSRNTIKNLTGLDWIDGNSIIINAQVTAMGSVNRCDISAIDPFPENDGLLRNFSNVLIHYHCWGDVDPSTSEADEDGSKAFRVDDWVIVLSKIEGNYPTRYFTPVAVTGFLDEKKPCMGERGVFIPPSGGSIYLAELEGDPAAGTLSFKNPELWGSANHVWFVGARYWVLSSGAIKYNPESGWYKSRDIAKEISCTGLPSNITEFSVWYDSGTYYMELSIDEGSGNESVKEHTSPDGQVWSYQQTIFSGFANWGTELRNTATTSGRCIGTGYWRNFQDAPAKDRYFIDFNGVQFRLYRIGLRTRFTSMGQYNTIIECMTFLAYDSGVQYSFAFENNFTLIGLDENSYQIIQIY